MSGANKEVAASTPPDATSPHAPLGFKILYLKDEDSAQSGAKIKFPPPLDEPANMTLFLPILTQAHIKDMQISPDPQLGGILDVSSMLFDQLDLLRYSNERLAWVLSVPLDTFWSIMCYDKSVAQFLDSFLLHYRAYCNAETCAASPLMAQPGSRMLLEQIARRVLMVYLRMSTRKEFTKNAPSGGASSAPVATQLSDSTVKYREAEAELLAEAGLNVTKAGATKSVGLPSYCVDDYGGLKDELYVDMFRQFPHLFPLYTLFDLCAIYANTNEALLGPMLARLLDTRVRAASQENIPDSKTWEPSYTNTLLVRRAMVLEPVVQVQLETLAYLEHVLLMGVSRTYATQVPEKLMKTVELVESDLRVLTTDRLKKLHATSQQPTGASIVQALNDLTDTVYSIYSAQRMFPREVSHAMSSLRAFPTLVRLFESTLPAVAYYLRLGQPAYRSATSLAPALMCTFELAKTYLACRVVEPAVNPQPFTQAAEESVVSEYAQCMQAMLSVGAGLPAFWLPTGAIARLQAELASRSGDAACSDGPATPQAQLLARLQAYYPVLQTALGHQSSGENVPSIGTMSPYTEYGTLFYFLLRDPVAQLKQFISARIAHTSLTVQPISSPIDLQLTNLLCSLVSRVLGLSSETKRNDPVAKLVQQLGERLPYSLPLTLHENAVKLLRTLSQTTLPALGAAARLELATKQAQEQQDAASDQLVSGSGRAVAQAPTKKDKSSDPSLEELEGWIASIREMFPLCGPGYLEAVLQHVNWNVDSAVAALLDESEQSLPKALRGMKDKDKINYKPKSTVAERLRARERELSGSNVEIKKSEDLIPIVNPSSYRTTFEAKSAASAAVRKGLLDEDENEAFAEYLRSTGRTLKTRTTNINAFADEAEKEMIKMHIRRMLVDEYDDEYDDALDGFDEHFVVDDDSIERERAVGGFRGERRGNNGPSDRRGKGGKPAEPTETKGEDVDEGEEEEEGGEDASSTEDDEAEERPKSTGVKRVNAKAEKQLDAKDLKILESRRQRAAASAAAATAQRRTAKQSTAADDRLRLDDDDDDEVSSGVSPFFGTLRGGSRGGARAGAGGSARRPQPIEVRPLNERGLDIQSIKSRNKGQDQKQSGPGAGAEQKSSQSQSKPPSQGASQAGGGGKDKHGKDKHDKDKRGKGKDHESEDSSKPSQQKKDRPRPSLPPSVRSGSGGGGGHGHR